MVIIPFNQCVIIHWSYNNTMVRGLVPGNCRRQVGKECGMGGVFHSGNNADWLQQSKSSKNTGVTTRLALGAGLRHVGYTLLHLSRKKCNRQNIDK